MKTPEQRLEEFKERLAGLLKEYSAEIEVRETIDPFWQYYDHRIFVKMNLVVAEDGCVVEGIEDDLGVFISPTP